MIIIENLRLSDDTVSFTAGHMGKFEGLIYERNPYKEFQDLTVKLTKVGDVFGKDNVVFLMIQQSGQRGVASSRAEYAAMYNFMKNAASQAAL